MQRADTRVVLNPQLKLNVNANKYAKSGRCICKDKEERFRSSNSSTLNLSCIYTGSQRRSFNATSSCFAIPNAVSYDIADLNMGGPSSLSGGDVRWSRRMEVRSMIYIFQERNVK
jgi:hypothetical protein